MEQKYNSLSAVRLLSLFLILSLFSCEKDELEFNDSKHVPEQSSEMDNYRRKIENPYTISNMQMALDHLSSEIQKGSLKDITGGKAVLLKSTIKPNILYVKFTPQNVEEESLLKKDSTLALIDYPLGYEYDDAFFTNRPALKEGEIATYYTSVPVDKKLPEGVTFEIMEEMYLPQEDEGLENSTKASFYRTAKNGVGDFIDVLLHQAFEQTGNEGLDGLGILRKEIPESENKLLGIEIGSKWLPEGTLRIWDDNTGSTRTYRKIFVRYEYYDCDLSPNILETPSADLVSANRIEPIEGCRRSIYRYEWDDNPGSYLPLKGAQVLLRDTYTIGNEITDSSGYFRFDHKRGEKRYIIQWERYQYSIRNGNLWQAEYRGPKKHSRWNHDIKGGETEYFANIHRGAHLYYYGDIGGLTRPPSNDSFWSTQVKIAGIDKDGTSSHKQQFRYGGVAPRIKIKAYGEPTEQVIGTTIHELAHAVHWRIDRGAYNNIVWDAYIDPTVSSIINNNDLGPTARNNRRLLESWATGVEIFLTRRFYRSIGDTTYEYRNSRLNGTRMGNYQTVTVNDNRGQFYTTVFWDMTDTFNQRRDFGANYSNLPLDNVSGFTMPQLEDALKGAEYWTEYRNNVLSQNPGISTTENINALFANWQ